MTRTGEIQRAVIFINLTAGGGRSRKIWPQIRSEVLQLLPKHTLLIPFDGQINLEEQLLELIEKEGVNCFISGGGDGSIHYLLNSLMDLKKPGSPAFFLGAIGLGSSNDFHKPYRAMIRGIPTRIGQKNMEQVDVGVIRFLTEMGEKQQRYFLINASLGVTAAANYFFNNGDKMIRFLKKKWMPGAILYAAVSTILSFRNYQATLIFAYPNDVQVSDIPRTISGKIVELAVRNVVHGKAVRNIDALANPEALDLFRDIEELRT